MSHLPLIPFFTLPRRKWNNKMEKKNRVEIVDDQEQIYPLNDDNEEAELARLIAASDAADAELQGVSVRASKAEQEEGKKTGRSLRNRSTKSGFKTSRTDNESGRTGATRESRFKVQFDRGMQEEQAPIVTKKEQEKIDLFKLFNELDDDPEISFWEVVEEVGFFNYLRFWRSAARKRRLHYILSEYERKVVAYDREEKDKISAEIEANERALLRHVELAETRRRTHAYAEKRKRIVALRNTRSLVAYDTKAAQQSYYCAHMADWAIEKHDIKIEEKAENERQIQIKKDIQTEKIKQMKRLEKVEAEKKIFEDDLVISQNILRIMRKTGTIEAVNAGDKDQVFKEPTKVIENEYLELHLKKGVNFTNWKNGKNNNKNDSISGKNNQTLSIQFLESEMEENNEDRKEDLFFSPFNVDLSIGSSKLLVLQCYLIGEKGAMCLAADFVKGACPYLEVLNLSNCEIQNRGFGKILHGLKIGKIKTITNLNLKNNFLCSKGLEYFRDSMRIGLFLELTHIDLSDNELKDNGLIVLIRLILSGDFINIIELKLQRNGITDIGFAMLIKTLRFSKEQKMPHLEHICMEGNQISAKIKKQFGALPLWYSF